MWGESIAVYLEVWAGIKFGDFCVTKLNLALKCMHNVRRKCVYNTGGFEFGSLLCDGEIAKFLIPSPNFPDIK